MTTMATGDGDNDVDGDGATDSEVYSATGDDNDEDDDGDDNIGDGRKRGGGGKERCNNQIEATAGRVATRGHSQIAILKISTLCSYKMRWYHVLRCEVHKKYVHQIIG
jgi:hypothetical protein